MIDLTAPLQALSPGADAAPTINSALSSLATTGGRVLIPCGHWMIGSSLVIPAGVVLEGDGRPSYNFVNRATFPGPWLNIMSGFDGPIVLIDSVHDITIDRIGIDGGDRGPTSQSVGLSIQANSTVSPLNGVFNVTIRECSFSCCGIGIDWGRGNLQEESDHILIQQCDFEGCLTGIRTNSSNAGDYSRIDNCKFNIVTRVAIDLIVHGDLTISDCAAGGFPDAVFIWRRGWSDTLIIQNCQCESIHAFLIVDAADDVHSVVLIGNTIDCAVYLNNICRVTGMGNCFHAPIYFANPAARCLTLADSGPSRGNDAVGVRYQAGDPAAMLALDMGGGRTWDLAGLNPGQLRVPGVGNLVFGPGKGVRFVDDGDGRSRWILPPSR